MVEQAIETPFPGAEDAGELVAGTPPPPGSQQPPPTPEEMGSSKFPPEAPGGAPAPPAPDVGPAQEFTMAEIQAAAEEMKKLPPQTFLAMKKSIENTGAYTTDLGEAGGIAWTTLWAESGAEFSVTNRATNATNALDGLVAAIVHAGNKYNLSPIPKGSNGGATVTNTTAGIETGTGDLNWISVDRNENDPSKLVVKFSVGKFKYPFQEHRGAKQALSLFDSAICEPRVQGGWSEAHFATPGKRYEINGTMKVDWEHRGKYYNVLLVHP